MGSSGRELRAPDSKTVQVRAHFGAGPVLRSDKLAPDDAFAVDHIGFRPHIRVEELGGRLGGVADGEEVDVAAGNELAVGIGVFVDADSDDGEIGLVAVQIDQRRQFFDAGTAPAGPEVEQNDLAAVTGEMDAG